MGWPTPREQDGIFQTDTSKPDDSSYNWVGSWLMRSQLCGNQERVFDLERPTCEAAEGMRRRRNAIGTIPTMSDECQFCHVEHRVKERKNS
jgi:hypothetical protein